MNEPHLKLISVQVNDKLETLSDDELMLLIQSQRASAFEVLLKRHQPLILAYTTRFLGDRDLACEICQEVFLTLWAERMRYKPQGKFRSYLLVLAAFRCKTALRQRKIIQTKAVLLHSEYSNSESRLPVDELLEAERTNQVQAQLLELNEPTRQTLILRFGLDLSYEEIAFITGKPEGTLKSLICRGLKQLKAVLPEEYCA